MAAFVLLLASFFIAPIPLDQSPYQDFVMVRGSVVDYMGHKNVAGAVVYATSDADVQATISDNKGYFYFLTLLPGNYRFSALKAGFVGDCMCCRQDAQELDAGFEYLATIILARACY